MHFAITRQWGKLDFKVWLPLIILTILSIGLFSYNAITSVKCPAMSLSVTGKLNHADENPNTFFVNEQITFTVETASAGENIIWEFGDEKGNETTATVAHIFAKEGNYLVTARVNGRCSESVNIRIIQPEGSSAEAPDLNPIVSNDIVSLGNETVFNTSAKAQSYTWSVEEMPELGKVNTPIARFIFNRPGNFTVSLALDNGIVHKKIIQVNDPLAQMGRSIPLPPTPSMDIPPAPVAPAPLPEKKEPVVKEEPAVAVKKEEPEKPAKPAKVYEQLPTPAIQAMLVGVTEGKKSIADFDNILCNGAGTKVMANDEATTFAALVNELGVRKGLPLMKKKRRIQEVKVVRDQANGNCISILYVDYK